MLRTRSALIGAKAEITGLNQDGTFSFSGVNYLVLNRAVVIQKNGLYASVGGSPREIILFDPAIFDKDIRHENLSVAEHECIKGLLQKLDDEISAEARAPTIDKVLSAICKVGHQAFNRYDFDRFNVHWIASDKPHYTHIPTQQKLPVVPFINFLVDQTGVCRHTSLLAVGLMHYAIKKGMLPEAPLHVFRQTVATAKGDLAHAWGVYKTNDDELYLVDPMWNRAEIVSAATLRSAASKIYLNGAAL